MQVLERAVDQAAEQTFSAGGRKAVAAENHVASRTAFVGQVVGGIGVGVCEVMLVQVGWRMVAISRSSGQGKLRDSISWKGLLMLLTSTAEMSEHK